MKSEQLIQLKELFNQAPRLKYKQIAQIMDLPFNVVAEQVSILQKNNAIKKRKNAGGHFELTQEQIDRLQIIADERKKGATWQQIGQKFGFTKQAIHNFVSYSLPELLEIEPDSEIDNRKKIKTLYNQFPRIPVTDIISQSGLPQKKVYSIIQYLYGRGELIARRHGSTTPTQQTLDRLNYIAGLRDKGLTWQKIADDLGITIGSLFSFVRKYVVKEK